nr:hypothetical protein [Deltaproteobacteria bacterium]
MEAARGDGEIEADGSAGAALDHRADAGDGLPGGGEHLVAGAERHAGAPGGGEGGASEAAAKLLLEGADELVQGELAELVGGGRGQRRGAVQGPVDARSQDLGAGVGLQHVEGLGAARPHDGGGLSVAGDDQHGDEAHQRVGGDYGGEGDAVVGRVVLGDDDVRGRRRGRG